MAMNGNGLNVPLNHISGNQAKLWTPAGPGLELAENRNQVKVVVKKGRDNKINSVALTYI